jgi:hypothetical protein
MKSIKLTSHFCCEAGAIPRAQPHDSNVREKFPGCGGSPTPQACNQRLDAIGRSPVPENFTF